jgi:hypothetical protein
LDKAKRDYAKSVGLAVNELSKEQEATARMNALLDVAGKKFSDVDLRVKTVSDGVAKVTNAFGDMQEAIGKIVANTSLPSWLDSVAGGINAVSEMITAKFGSGIESVRAQIPQLNGEIANLRAEIILLEQNGLGLWDRLFNSDVIDEKKARLKELEDQLARLGTGEIMGPPTAEQAGVGGKTAQEKANQEKRLENERKFQEEINKLRLQEAENSIKLAQDAESLELAQEDRRLMREQELAIKKQEIRNNEMLTKQQQDALILEQESLHQQQMLMLQQQEEAEYNAMLQRKLENTNAIDEQIALSAEIRGNQVANSWKKAGGLGGAFVQSFGNRAVNAFQAMGSGAMTASEAVKGAMFGMIADVAANYGKMMMLSSIFPPNPLAFAAGAALVALSGALGAKAGGGQMGGDVGGGGIGGGFGTAGGFGGPSINEATEKRKEVNITIEGNYYDNEATRLQIVQAVRDAGDSADFNIQRGNRRSR